MTSAARIDHVTAKAIPSEHPPGQTRERQGDRHLKSNTSKKRTHSLFRQGAMLYELIPMMPEPRLRPLVDRFGAMLLEIPAFDAVYGVI